MTWMEKQQKCHLFSEARPRPALSFTLCLVYLRTHFMNCTQPCLAQNSPQFHIHDRSFQHVRS